MLIRYNKNYEKIAMGLLSFNPNEKELQNLLKTINEYDKEQNLQLYLWKEEEGIIGVVGIELNDQEILLHHLSVNPSHRDKGFGKLMVEALLEIYPDNTLSPTETTASFLEKLDLAKETKMEHKNKRPVTI
ncbi:riboflavin biosynthesis RibT protein [Mesobacillus persicus]|uniref:Riboflavin biosynthesis RibT protein n=1 Tax=Mesobacillus persicus TaxID=930146 RepID=A0A1H7VTU3_9BACI|nr:GNAT family N-acetyltransferase [Mesobacillus persicus]SEM12227.1 riboflavin biosynthesis RibT protein [Mesobacillus persicus]